MEINENTTLIAIAVIVTRDPHGDRLLTGKFDKDGQPEFRHAQRQIQPGERFTSADLAGAADPVTEAQRLVELGSAHIVGAAIKPMIPPPSTSQCIRAVGRGEV